jgi:hypothetical protein
MEVNPSWPCGRSPSYWMVKQQQRRTWEENMLENYRRGRATSTRCFNENIGVLENLEFAGSSKHEPGTWLQDKGIGYPAGTRRCIRPDKHAPFRQSECSCPASAAPRVRLGAAANYAAPASTTTSGSSSPAPNRAAFSVRGSWKPDHLAGGKGELLGEAPLLQSDKTSRLGVRFPRKEKNSSFPP